MTESLGGVRVIKGYHAEEREAGVFSVGVERLLQNVMKSLTLTSALSAASMTVLGLVSSVVMWLGGHRVLGEHMDGRRLLQLQHVYRLHDCAGVPDCEHRHAIDGGFCRPGSHQRNHGRTGRESEPRAHRKDAAHSASRDITRKSARPGFSLPAWSGCCKM